MRAGIVFDGTLDTTTVTLTVGDSGRFALFPKLVPAWERIPWRNDASECDTGVDCHYVSVGGTPVWPSSMAFASVCEESVLNGDGTWQTGTCPDGSCNLGGQCGSNPRRCAGNGTHTYSVRRQCLAPAGQI